MSSADVQPHITPFPFWRDPLIDEQVRLIITDALRRHQAFLQPTDPLPTDSPEAKVTPAIDRSLSDDEIPRDLSLAMSFVDDAIEAVRTNNKQDVSLFIDVMDEVRSRSRESCDSQQ